MSKKKFHETKVGKFLLNKGSDIGDIAADLLPSSGVFGVIKNLIDKDPALPAEDKEKAMKLLELDIAEMENVSKRWDSDMKSDSWLSKNTRPLSLIFLSVSMIFLILLDSLNIDFDVEGSWIELLKNLLVTVYVAYFGSRGVEKFSSIKK
tara:strand:+ start:27 stop:476 length:450 start_codon:yes stop_codon:yes gene_type:complete